VILVGNQRGSAGNLAVHLLKPENEHIEVHEIRGFASDDLKEALNEAHAVSKGTRCKQFLYSLSLNPPPQENVKTEVFEDAIDRIEVKLGLSGQPRAIVFHEKEGPGGVRRHAHAVWSRINTIEMKAVQLSFTKKKLRDVSRELYIEHGWKMPRGFVNSHERDSKNFTLAEWQQAKRAGKDPRAIKENFADAWAITDSKAAFTQALAERGYKVARGDRRGFVAVDVHGEVYSIPRQAGVKTKDVRLRLGEEKKLPSVAETKNQHAQEILPKLNKFQEELDAKKQQRLLELKFRKTELVQRQREERTSFLEATEKRQIQETQQRQARFRIGIKGIWDRLRGENKRIQEQNTVEAKAALTRDRSEKDQLIFQQLAQRREFSAQRMEKRQNYIEQRRELSRDIQTYQQMRSPTESRETLKKNYTEKRQNKQHQPVQQRGPTLKP
jgi:MobA/VirD2-like, nuclease domain